MSEKPTKEAVAAAQRFMRWLCIEDNSCQVHAECPRDGWDACGPGDCEAVGVLAEMIDGAVAAHSSEVEAALAGLLDAYVEENGGDMPTNDSHPAHAARALLSLRDCWVCKTKAAGLPTPGYVHTCQPSVPAEEKAVEFEHCCAGAWELGPTGRTARCADCRRWLERKRAAEEKV